MSYVHPGLVGVKSRADGILRLLRHRLHGGRRCESFRCSDLTCATAVHVFSVPQSNDNNQQDVVLNRVNDAVIADPHAHAGPTLKCPGGRRTRVLAQEGNCSLYSAAVLVVHAAQGLHSRRSQLDAVTAHTQPRSALT